MQVAPAKENFTAFSPALSGHAIAASSEASRRIYLLIAIVGLALVLRLYGLSLYPLEIDEYGSIWEARTVGLNWNSIIYSSVMHFWMQFGASDFWLRLPAALFGAATVPILFKIGEKLAGWRTGLVAGILAAVSPFNIYHSQQVRFYSLFIFSSAAFMLATIQYVDSPKAKRNRLALILVGLLLMVSHFLGVLGLYAQGSAAFLAAGKRRSLVKVLIVMLVLPLLIFGLPLVPAVQTKLWSLYQVYGAAQGHSPAVTPISVISFAKLAFAGFVFVFGYHVYPLRLILVVAGLSLSGFLLACGTVRIWKQHRWKALPFTYLMAVVGVYLVLDSVGGRLAAGVSPRHIAFAWPAFIVLLALGLSSFRKTVSSVLLVALLSVNALSLGLGWKRDWSYGATPDYRQAAEYASRWGEKDTAIVNDVWAHDPIDFYFPKRIPVVKSTKDLRAGDLNQVSPYQRLIFVTNTWHADVRRESDQILQKLGDGFTCIDGRVDYPLFEYVLERGVPVRSQTGQLRQPLSIYGLEFQDLRLPVSVEVQKTPLQIIGAYGLPDSTGLDTLTIPLAQPTKAHKLILLTNVVPSDQLSAEQQIAEAIVEKKGGASETFPLRLGEGTALWDQQCAAAARCETVYQWHKRLALVGHNAFPGAWRDFQAGLHGTVFNLSSVAEIDRLTIRYLAGNGHLYIWGIALVN